MAGQHWQRFKLVTGLILGCCLLATSTMAMELGGADISIRSTTKYRLQWSDSPAPEMLVQDDSDQDFFETLSADINWREQGLTFSTMASYAKDIDGTRSGSIFQDYTDSRGSHRQDFECYYAYLEKTGLCDDNLTVRAGRQYAYGAESIHFDGLWTHLDIPSWLNMELEGFGGLVVQHYSDLGPSGIGGGNLRIHPMSGLSLELNAVVFEETSWEAQIYWQPSDIWTARSRVAFINDHTRFIDASLSTTIPTTGTTLDFSFYRRYAISSQADYLFDFSYTLDEALSETAHSFYLMQEQGYIELDFRISQPVSFIKGLTVYGRYTNRTLSEGDDEDLYNTDFQRVTAGFDLEEGVTWTGFKMSAGFSRWWEDRDKFYEEESTSWFVDLHQELFERLALEAGYYHKNEDVNSLIEDEASTRWRSAIAYQMCDHSRIKLEYEYAEDDYYEEELGIDHINTLTVSLDIDF
jgi:hypothetical protein